MSDLTAAAELAKVVEHSQSSVRPVKDVDLNQLIYVIVRLADQITKDPPPGHDHKWSTLVSRVRRQLPKSLHIKEYYRQPK